MFPISIMRLIALTCALLVGGANAADMNKIVRWEFQTAETGFDPALVSDLYSNTIIEAILEPPLTYDYLASPPKLVPNTLVAMPVVGDDGKTYTLKVKRGIYFTPDPAFKGKRRELTAADYAYTIKRFMDPKNHSQYEFLVEGKIVGLDELAAQAKKHGDTFDYDAQVEGLDLLDRYTLRIKLKATDYNFAYILAMPTLGAVAREVIEAYAGNTNAHPVGTGPFVLKKWIPASKIFLEANPNYREVIWNFAASADPEDQRIVAQMKGKKLPQIGRIEVNIMEEEQSRWLAFKNGELDVLWLPASFAPVALPNNKLASDLAAKGVQWDRIVEPTITYTAFNMKDPIIGGFSKEKIALRRALIMAYDNEAEIRIIRKNQAVNLEMPVPPSVVGYDPHYRSSIPHEVAAANKLLDKLGYKRGTDGWRMLPDGQPLVIRNTSETTAVSREYDELWKKAADSIGIRMENDKGKFSDHYRAAKECQLQMWGQAWGADYPDADNFMQLLYGGNVGKSNNACYESKAFDALYEKAKLLPDSPERNRLYAQMSRQFEVDGPWRLGVGRYRNQLAQPQVKGYKKHPILHAEWLYIDIEPRAQ